MNEIVKVMKALSDETRLRILNVVLQRECCVCEVMQALDISETRASRNLGLLQDAGFLKATRDGTWILYSIDKEGMKNFLPALVGVVGQALADNPQAALDSQRLKTAERIGPRCAAKKCRSTLRG